MIFILVPVHNRLGRVRTFVKDLRAQVDAPEFRLVVIDAGSTDGTQGFLAAPDPGTGDTIGEFRIDLVQGRHDWWWSRAIAAGLDHILPALDEGDRVLILNDDVSLAPGYLARIAALSDERPRALITSCLVAPGGSPDMPFHYGVAIDPTGLTFHDVVPQGSDGPAALIHSDVASGRGTLFPAGAILGGVRPRVRALPHYLADYDMGLQARALGYEIVGRRDVYVTTEEAQGNTRKFPNRIQYWTRTESPGRLLTWWNFWTSPVLGMGPVGVVRNLARRGSFTSSRRG